MVLKVAWRQVRRAAEDSFGRACVRGLGPVAVPLPVRQTEIRVEPVGV